MFIPNTLKGRLLKMKKNPLLLILLIVTLGLGCSNMRELITAKADLKSPAVTVPVKIINGVILTPVRINDSEKMYNFMVDTGSFNAISTDLANELGIREKMRIIIPTVSGEIRDVPVGIAQKFEVGNGVSLNPTGLTIQNLDIIKNRVGVKVDGLIGNTFLKHFETTIDYEFQKLMFQLPYETNIENVVPEPNVFVMPLKISIKEGLAPKLMGKINNTVKAPFTIDTGNLGMPFISHGTAVHLGYLDDPNLEMAEIAGEAIGGYTGLYQQPIIGKFESIEFGTLKIGPHLFLSGQSDANSLGYYVLRHFRITLNYEKNMIIFRKWEKKIPRVVKSTCWLAIGLKDEKYIVSGLVKGSQAHRAGLSAFDVILEINGEKTSKLGLKKIQEILIDDAIDTIIFKIQGKDKLIKVDKSNLLNLKACLIQEPSK